MSAKHPVDLADRRELLVDDYLIDHLNGAASLRMHRPVPREIALEFDRPWEGNMGGYATVFADDGRFRMYYKCQHVEVCEGEVRHPRPLQIATAESDDGVHWTRPDVGVIEFDGSTDNNLVWAGADAEGSGVHGFAPFRDNAPGCDPAARYKAVGAQRRAVRNGLFAMISPDGYRWSALQDGPILTDGAFDSQNLAFYDAVRGEYRVYLRDFRDGRRDIRTAVSQDFVHWTEPEWLDYPGAPDEQLYTNQVLPYYRAPHIFIGLPTRYVEREWSPTIEALPEVDHRRLRASASLRFGTALTDTLLMTSRDGRTFQRRGEAFIPPGPQLEGNWAYGDNYAAWGMIETPPTMDGAPSELSLYATEGYWRGESNRIRRYTLRIDGFVSLGAPRQGGEIITRPLTFAGARLSLNVATSAAGGVRVELRTPDGEPIDGFALDECSPVLGDALDCTVRWGERTDVSALAGRPVRLRVALSDADVYSFRFAT